MAVYDELFPFVWRTARHLGVSPASVDDICQDVFVVVHRRLPEIEARMSLKPWVYAILHNRVLVHRRELRRKSPEHRTEQPLVDVDLLTDHGSDPHEQLSSAEAARMARRLLDELDDEKRTIVELVELDEMPITDVAVTMGANLNTTYARLRAARRELAQAAQRLLARDRFRMHVVDDDGASSGPKPGCDHDGAASGPKPGCDHDGAASGPKPPAGQAGRDDDGPKLPAARAGRDHTRRMGHTSAITRPLEARRAHAHASFALT
ncbi:RNA polymerase sigma factor RpoE [Minicystis rosea]|nr:RNA polymerase sigma factor RpoE [Minicystis rosea]